MLHGLVGKPLPEKAVRLAAGVDEEVKRARSAIQAARLDGDADRLLELSRSEHLAWSNSPMLGCAIADALIALKRNDEAIELSSKLCEGFPKTLRPRQLQGLTFARKGDWRKAQAILGELYAAGEIDPETLGIYTGINAATKSLLLDEQQTAQQIAQRVEQLVGTKAVPGKYWETATVAEVQLLQGHFVEAGKLYQAAVVAAPEEIGSHQTTYNQALLILDHLNASENNRTTVLEPFTHLANPARMAKG
jgi:predicted Zn-dependent protease